MVIIPIKWFLIAPHPLTNFEIQKYYQNEPKFNECSDIGTHWVALYVNNNNVTYFKIFGVEHIPKEIKAFIIRFLSITTNIFRIQG